MPERYTLARSKDELEEFFGFELPENFTPRYNAAPAQLLPVITSVAPEGFSYFFWGTIPGWAGNKTLSKKIISVSAVDLQARPMYRKALKTHRCIIPADGYYFWHHVGKKTRIPYRVVANDHSMLAFGGIWEEFEDENDQSHHSFRIVTVDPSSSLDEMDESMPLMLDKENMMKWIASDSTEDELIRLCTSFDQLEYFTVTSKIDNTEIDNPTLVQRVDSMNQHGNYSLFD